MDDQYDYGQQYQYGQNEDYGGYDECGYNGDYGDYADGHGQGDYENYFESSSFSKFQVLPQSALFMQVEDLAKQTMAMTNLPFGWSLILLREFKWNIQEVPEYFQNPIKEKAKIQYSEDYSHPDTIKPSQQTDPCVVCCEEGRQIRNVCGHSFCENCWMGHIEQNLGLMNPFMKCMGCTVPLLFEIVKLIIEGNPNHKKINQRFQKQLCQLFSTSNRSYQCCPGVDCANCIKCEDYNVTNVKCVCGKLFCFKCRQNDHSPCSCDQRSRWIDMVMKEEADAKWMALHTKLCPWCNKAVQRSAGCNFMACVCGKSFCYMCSKPWEPDHKDHFKCHIYKKKDGDTQNKEKEILQKMNFYAEKYLNTNALVIHLSKVDTFQKRRLLFQTLKIDLTQSDFIDKAYCFAIECCDSLKWIYVYQYFVKFTQKQKQEAMEFTQGEYQKYKEQLLKKLSYDLKNYLQELEATPSAMLNHEEMVERFLLLKKNITNYYTCTKQFKEKFVGEIQRIDYSLIKRNSEVEPVGGMQPEMKKLKSSKGRKK